MGLPTADNIYPYNPTLAPAAIFSALYLLWTAWHLYLSILLPRHLSQKHRYTIPLFVAGFLSTLGYGVRIGSIQDTSSVTLYAQSASYIVIAPIFVCATLYLLLTHLIRTSLPSHQQHIFNIPARWLGRIFIFSDITSFLTQGAGSGVASSGNWKGSLLKAGINMLLAGLALQLATFTVFLVFLWRFSTLLHDNNHHHHHSPTNANPNTNTANITTQSPTHNVLTGITIASLFVQLRSIYRLVEFAMGINGYLFQHEWCLFVFESVPMWIALGVLAWYHPVKHLSQEQSRSGDEENK